MDILELSDIHPAAFLSCAGLGYQIKNEAASNGKRRVIFIFEGSRARELCRNFYSSRDDMVSASNFSRVLKEMKSVVHNF